MLDSNVLPTLGGYWSGRFHTSAGGPTFDVQDPATRELLATLPSYGATETGEALAAAVKASRTVPSLEERSRWLSGFADALRQECKALAAVITAENGKPLAEAEGEVLYATGFFEDAVRHLGHLEPQVLALTPKKHSWTVHHRPAGVAALITPWNFPIAMLAKKLAGALAAGCAVVVKPSELTPLSCIAMFTLLDGLDLPEGQVNLVFGDAAAIGGVLCDSRDVRVLSFTGSTKVGRLLARQSADSMKRLSLELGGNAPFVVFADADLEHAADQLMANKFRCAGQTCVCTNRVLVASSVHDAFVAKVVKRVATLKVGPGDADGVQIGPLINVEGWKKVHSLVSDALLQGAELAHGELPSVPDGGNFFEPLVVTGLKPGMRCAREEIFGPVIVVGRFDDEEEAVELANDTEYGLAAYLFSGEREQLERVAAQLHFGHVGLNTGTGPTPEAPFGGMQQSGVGREGGLEGVLEYVEIQTCPTPLEAAE